MLTFDPRTISTQVYNHLNQLKNNSNSSEHSEQKSQAVELYTYIATWGLLRLKAEEAALTQKGKQDLVKCFFKTLGSIAASGQSQQSNRLSQSTTAGIDYLTKLSPSEYLGLTGLALQVAREFSFWAEAIYLKDKSQTTTQA